MDLIGQTRLVRELLTANRGLQHRTAQDMDEYGHTGIVVGGLRRGAFTGDDGRGLCRELVVAGLEVVERRLVPEEDELARGLTADREAYAGLGDVCRTDRDALLVHHTRPVSAGE